MRKIKPGRVGYTVWCDDTGMVHDDGTIFHLSEGDYRLCAQERCMDWLQWSAEGFDVEVVDETEEDLSSFVAVLEESGVTVKRPQTWPHEARFSTIDWQMESPNPKPFLEV